MISLFNTIYDNSTDALEINLLKFCKYGIACSTGTVQYNDVFELLLILFGKIYVRLFRL